MRQALLALMLCSAEPALAQVAAFDPQDYGSAQLIVRQSTGDAARFIAASEGGAFEPIGELTPGDRMASLAQPVGRLDVLVRDPATGEEGASACTASLLGAGLVLTNHHCVPQDGSLEILRASILMDYHTLAGQGSERFILDPVPVEFRAELDYAILRLSDGSAPSERYGHVALDSAPDEAGSARTVIHHPLGRPKVMSRFRCFALGGRVEPPVVAHRCDTLPGSSGSPVFDDEGLMVALHFAGGLDPSDPSSFNMAVDIGTILSASELLGTTPAAAPPSAAGGRPLAAGRAEDPDATLDADGMNDILRGN